MASEGSRLSLCPKLNHPDSESGLTSSPTMACGELCHWSCFQPALATRVQVGHSRPMNSITRRHFLHGAATGAAALSQFPALLQAADPDARLKLGLIGCGWYGMVDLKAALKVGGVDVVALCDVDREHLDSSADEVEKLQGRRPRSFKLYEELLQTPGLEAVIIATPPHWHALQLIAALERGMDVYCEKPLSYDIREGRAMVEAVRRSNRVVQIGFQRRHSKSFQQVK